jgi:hypothetical protein
VRLGVTVQNGVPTYIGKAKQIKKRTKARGGREFVLSTAIGEPVGALVPRIPIVCFNVRKSGTGSAAYKGIGLYNAQYGMHNRRDVVMLPNGGN